MSLGQSVDLRGVYLTIAARLQRGEEAACIFVASASVKLRGERLGSLTPDEN